MHPTSWTASSALALFAFAAVAAEPTDHQTTASPATLSFTYTIGGALPPPQSLSLSGNGMFFATATSTGNWLTVGALAGPLPSVLAVTASPQGLSPGTYQGAISLTDQVASSQVISVTLTIRPALPPPPGNISEGLTLNPAALTFAYQAGAANSPSQNLSVSGNAGASFTLVAMSAGWLVASPLSATSPATVTVSVNVAGLTAGTYSGAVIFASTVDGVRVSQNANVTLTVSGPAAPPAPFTLTSIVNAASLLGSPLAPGEIVSIFGSGLGPDDPEIFAPTSANTIPSTLAGTRVLIDGKAAPILFTQSEQVNAIVPYSVAGNSTVPLVVEYKGAKTVEGVFAINDAAPAIFTLEGSGRGQAAALNEDTSVNFDLNPADRGSIAVLYATGAGLMTPSSPDGTITGSTLSHPLLPVSVLVDGQIANVIYAGSAPGQVAGVLQVNFRVPSLARTGPAIGILLKVGRFTSQSGVTLSIR